MAQVYHIYSYETPHIKISIYVNDQTISSGLLCPFNKAIPQLWSEYQPTFFPKFSFFSFQSLFWKMFSFYQKETHQP